MDVNNGFHSHQMVQDSTGIVYLADFGQYGNQKIQAIDTTLIEKGDQKILIDTEKTLPLSFNPCGILNFALSNDNCLYDLTLHGAQELNAKIGAVENVYYFSYACCGTEPSADGRFQNPTDVLGSMAGTGWLIGHIAGITVDGVKLEGDWLRNDGAVPVKSALYPEGERYEFIVDHEGAYERGVWYVYPVVENANHSTLLGSKTESYIDLYMNQIDIVNAK